MASRCEGEGGRGAGFMVCATARGIVGMLHDEITGSIAGEGEQNMNSDRTYIDTHWYNLVQW